MAITRLWFLTLQPDHSASDPAFLSLWTNILELCASYTPAPVASGSQVHLSLSMKPKRPHHYLLQSTRDETLLVLISSYPSLALCRQADAAYRAKHRDAVLGHVRHRALRQLDIEDAEVVPTLLHAAGGEGREGVTVTISERNPLGTEIAEARRSGSGSGGRPVAPVLPPNREISGADAFEVPLPPRDGGQDLFEAQRGEGKRWILIRRGLPVEDEGTDEVFQLKELLSR